MFKIDDREKGFPESYKRDGTPSHRNAFMKHKPHHNNLPSILVIDDDISFGTIMYRVARSNGIQVYSCLDLEEFEEIKQTQKIDVVVVDFHLGVKEMNGLETAKFISEQAFPDIPIILTSYDDPHGVEGWPAAVKEFVHKRLGPYAILEAACDSYEESHKPKLSLNIEKLRENRR